MLSPIPESKSKRSAEIAEQIRLSRVKITKLPGYEPVPRPARFHPKPKPKVVRAHQKLTAQQQKDLQDVALIRKYCDAHSQRYTGMLTGLSPTTMKRLTAKFELTFAPTRARRIE